jgi:excisionase family DNA binding protein
MGNLLTVAEAAERMSVAEKTVYKWFWAGDLTGVKIGRCVRIDEDALNDFLESHKNGRPAPTVAPTRPAVAAPAVYRYLPRPAA